MKNLKDVMAFSRKVEYVFIATANKDGEPGIDTVKTIKLDSRNRVVIKEWLCDCTVMNLYDNKNCTLLVWDENKDEGFGLTGQVTEMQTLAFLEGHKFGDKKTKTLPQVLWRIVMDVKKIGKFSHAPKERLRVITQNDRTITKRMSQL